MQFVGLSLFPDKAQLLRESKPCLLYTSSAGRMQLKMSASALGASSLIQEVQRSSPVTAVSYTHLDVYKRQEEYGA